MTTVSHPELSVSVPATWRRRRGPDLERQGVVVAVRAPSLPASGVRPEIVVRGTALDPGLDAATWRRAALDALAGVLVDFALEDDDAYELEGRPVRYHRFAHRLAAADVLCDQWAWLVPGPAPYGVTLTGSAARTDYPHYCDLFEAVAATVEPATRGATRLAGA